MVIGGDQLSQKEIGSHGKFGSIHSPTLLCHWTALIPNEGGVWPKDHCDKWVKETYVGCSIALWALVTSLVFTRVAWGTFLSVNSYMLCLPEGVSPSMHGVRLHFLLIRHCSESCWGCFFGGGGIHMLIIMSSLHSAFTKIFASY